MAIRRLALLVFAGATAIVAMSLISGVPSLFIYAIRATLSPSSISWDSKIAYVKCEGAIADPARWPSAPVQRCEAMHMCANEASLSSTQTTLLTRTIRSTPGCPEL